MTAHRAVHASGEIHGKVLLVTGGAGAVGHYAIQLAKMGGAQVIATVSSIEKEALARAAGADVVVNYRMEDVAKRVMEVTKGAGVDTVVEVEFGGNLETSVEVLKVGGSINTYASEAVREPVVPFYQLLYKSIAVNHILVFQIPEEAKRRAIDEITSGLVAGTLTHRVGAAFALDDIVAAHEAVEAGTLGKVVINRF
jgi:NADPH2:quinone reductase